ncbi:MAG: hypothetical protein JSR24_07545 [Proteobacteria bacterium]|nr:hypothetical protein [Pseudomonadota bacterium]
MTDGLAKENPRIWNSLEICKLAATIATPLIALVLGCMIWSIQRDVVQRSERDLAQQRRLIEADLKERDLIRDLRLSIYNKAAPLLDDIVAYHFYVGRSKDTSPAEIIEKKRRLDETLYPHRAVFTPEFFARYNTFMGQAFLSAGNHYDESSIRTSLRCRKRNLGESAEKWQSYFTNEDMRRGVCIAYARLLSSMSEELLLRSLKMSGTTETERLCPPFYPNESC